MEIMLLVDKGQTGATTRAHGDRILCSTVKRTCPSRHPFVASPAASPKWKATLLGQQVGEGIGPALDALMKVPPYVALGLMDWGDAGVVAVLAPVAVFGAWLGYRITRIIPERVFFFLVEIALFAISMNLIRVGLTGA
jgi:hypothetical protein